MKRIIQFLLITTLLAGLVLGTITVVKPDILPFRLNVGWNTGVSWDIPDVGELAWGIIHPLGVGWNTGVSWDMPDAAPVAYIGMRPNVGWNT